MSKTVLVVGFKYDSCVALKDYLIQKYYTDKNLTIALPATDPTTDTARATYYAGSIYENWYGWTPTQKYNAYKEARSTADAGYTAAKTTINPYIRKFNTGNNIIVGIPLIELNDTTNNYKIVVSDPRNANSDINCVSLQLTSTQINTFKSLVNALKTTEKPQFYLMNANTNNYTVDSVT